MRPDMNVAVAGLCGALLVLLCAGAWMQPGGGWRLSALALVGGGIGAVLLRTSFGFAGAFRSLVAERDSAALRAHALMLGTASLLMLPMLAQGSLLGQRLHGEATPVGVGFAAGALLFGAGMQIGGGCASGTLFALGSGNAKLAATVAGFVLGSVLGAWSMGFWWRLPALPPETLQGLVGFGPALALQLGVLGLVWLLAGRAAKMPPPRLLLTGGVGLAVLNAATLLLAGKPWGETSAFALWGSKLAASLGFDVAHWVYWTRPAFAAQLARPVSLDVTSVMDTAIILGAALAAASTGTFRARWGGNARAWTGALLGGIAMGYGARLANGCNIGAYFSAIAAGSLSGWAWLVLALAGSWIGVRLRPLFRLDAQAIIRAVPAGIVPPDASTC
jgi:uncharacterized membrane protein YedE/YeeE